MEGISNSLQGTELRRSSWSEIFIHRKKNVLYCEGVKINWHSFGEKFKVAYRNIVQFLDKYLQHNVFMASEPDMPKFVVTLDGKEII